MAETLTRIRVLTLGTILVMVVGTGSSIAACARPPGAAQALPVVQGRIVDVRPQWMMLNNGTELTVPDDVVPWSQLSLGSVVRVQYEERNGKKVATSMDFLEGRPGQQGL